MKTINTIIGKALLLLTLPLGVYSCTDEWDTHYQTVEQGSGSLWEEMSAQSDMKNFQRLLQATGYDRVLNSSQSFTVFAPTDAVLTDAECQSLILSYQEQQKAGLKEEDNTVVKEVVMNHIAMYNHSVSSYTKDSIVMINGKYQILGKDNLGGASFAISNIATKNGILYKLDKKVPYIPNIYEYLSKDADLDSVYAFFHKFDVYEFQPDQSVPGEIIDGQTHYLDSVTELSNPLFRYLAPVNREDSSYMTIFPTNEVWEAELKKNQAYYVYDKTVELRDSFSYMYPRLQILESSFFSRSYNGPDSIGTRLKSNLSIILTTSMFHTAKFALNRSFWCYSYSSLTKTPMEYVFGGATEAACSNGQVYKTSDWSKFSNLLLRNGTIDAECELNISLDSVYTKSSRPLSYIYMTQDNPFYDQVSLHRFVELSPKASSNPSALFNIYDVLSNVEYDIYAVTVPPMAADTMADPMINQFRATVFYNDENGVQQKTSKFPSASGSFDASAEKVDTIKICSMTFPTSSFGLDRPQVKILIEGTTKAADTRKGTHTRTSRIDQFILVPKY